MQYDGPAPDEPGGWGPMWELDENGVPTDTLLLYPGGTAEHHVEWSLTSPGFERTWSEGPYTSTDDSPLALSLALPADFASADDAPARLSIRVTAIEPGTGRVLGHTGAALTATGLGTRAEVRDRAPGAASVADTGAPSEAEAGFVVAIVEGVGR